ncbi:MAG: recombinase family protein, partial [Chloroflexota bacterium]|nr:recombinase family protein [Chloroflexota bacterium]
QDVDLPVDAQLNALRDYSRENDYVVVREYVDEDERVHIVQTPQFGKMIDEASLPKAAFHKILVWKLSRFTPSPEHDVALRLMLLRRGVHVGSIAEHVDYTPTGKLMEVLLEGFHEARSFERSLDVTSGMREAASRGFWISSHVPFGYKRVSVQDRRKKRSKLETDAATAPVVKRIFDMAEAGRTTVDIARILNEEGVASSKRKPWSKTSVRSILTSEVYTGTLLWGASAKSKIDPVRVEEAFPAIVSKAQFFRVRKQVSSGAP